MTTNGANQGHKHVEYSYCVDPRTGKIVKVKPEDLWDHIVAILAICYLLVTLALFLWQLFSIAVWNEISWFGNVSFPIAANSALQLALFTFIGGALGGIANAMRSFNFWHCEKQNFDRLKVWTYVTKPWLGGTLALFVVAIVYSGIGILGGVTLGDTIDSRAWLSVFTIGALAGFGAYDLYRWLDAQVTRLFKVTTVNRILTPTLMGKTQEQATKILQDARLNIGQQIPETRTEDEEPGKVKRQIPLPNEPINIGEAVDIIIAEPA